MCEAYSLIIDKEGICYANSFFDNHSHSDIINDFPHLLKEENTNQVAQNRSFVRIEITPLDKDYHSNVDTWKILVDEEGSLPDWYLSGQRFFEDIIRKEAKSWQKDYNKYYKNNKRNGEFEKVNSNGHYIVTNYKDGKLHGKCEYVNSDNSWFIANYKDGKLHGKMEHVYYDGAWVVINYKDGKLHGKCKDVNSDGSWHIENFKNGELHGTCEYVNSDGSWVVYNYKDGQLIILDK